MIEDISYAWVGLLNDILTNGKLVSPRGQVTKEILQKTIIVNMRKPVLTVPKRNLSYKFMAAEAHWILTGDNRVSSIAPYNSHICQFSDDGVVFYGAYGPRIQSQIEYVIRKLKEDQNSRQAGLTIWIENPIQTKDVPCTVSIFFNIRNGKLNCHVFMRSSDAWLGIPYDVFNFSMLSHMVCCFFNSDEVTVTPGTLYLTAVSSHLYERNFDAARECISAEILEQPPTPEVLYTNGQKFAQWLNSLKDTAPRTTFLRWWEVGSAV